LLCHGTVCVVGKIRDLILQLSKSSIYSTKPFDDHNTIERLTKESRVDDLQQIHTGILLSSHLLKELSGKGGSVTKKRA
ncbi:flagellar transcriptional regulator FlhD, partial [Serratia fonticola]|uniref:flagellar transcriptional regulator FlhD n=1 Tax=Serratia fonticola TaxID=47917 RepID=UPI003AAE1195